MTIYIRNFFRDGEELFFPSAFSSFQFASDLIRDTTSLRIK